MAKTKAKIKAKTRVRLDEDAARPFADDVEERARCLVARYSVVSRFDEEFGEWNAHPLEYPEALGTGKTERAAIAAARQGAMAGVCTMLEAGQSPPQPARAGVRSQQVNIRLTPEEKAMLESRSRTKGFRGIADYVRSTVLEQI